MIRAIPIALNFLTIGRKTELSSAWCNRPPADLVPLNGNQPLSCRIFDPDVSLIRWRCLFEEAYLNMQVRMTVEGRM